MTIGLGRCRGIPVRVRWSVLTVALVIAVGAGAGGFPSAFPDRPGAAYLVAGVVLAAGVVGSLLARDVAQALAASREGYRVEAVAVSSLAGAGSAEGTARDPGAELRVAGAGPMANLLVAAVSGMVAWASTTAEAGALFVAVSVWLAVFNLLLVVVGLVPVAPLDGGRLLRAALCRRWDDPRRAAVVGVRVGRGFGFTLVLLGVFAMSSGTATGLWWSLAGVFVVVAAGAEQRRAEPWVLPAGLRVRDVMTPDPDIAGGDRTVGSFLDDVVLRRRHSAFPLVDDIGRLQGLITLRRLRDVPPDRRDTTRLRDVACPPAEIPKAEPDDALPELLSDMGECTDGRALVFEQGHLVGIVSPSDISRAVLFHGLGVIRASG